MFSQEYLTHLGGIVVISVLPVAAWCTLSFCHTVFTVMGRTDRIRSLFVGSPLVLASSIIILASVPRQAYDPDLFQGVAESLQERSFQCAHALQCVHVDGFLRAIA